MFPLVYCRTVEIFQYSDWTLQIRCLDFGSGLDMLRLISMLPKGRPKVHGLAMIERFGRTDYPLDTIALKLLLAY